MEIKKNRILVSNPKAASALDAWKGINNSYKNKNNHIPEPNKNDKLHICVPLTSQFPSRKVLPIYLEFVSHHLLIGASHIYLPVPFGWNSYYMRQFLEIFQSYIQEGKYLKKN